VEKAILAMSDPIALESLLAQAIQSDTMDEFAEALESLLAQAIQSTTIDEFAEAVQ
jgi:hypothetical protein